jgi:hypothetical protein
MRIHWREQWRGGRERDSEGKHAHTIIHTRWQPAKKRLGVASDFSFVCPLFFLVLSPPFPLSLSLLSQFHYGSHYSSAAAVLYYLIRTEPFTQTLITFQSGRFDRPDRIFHSVASTWRSASALSTSDVKELIPEFYYFSEMMRNGNRLQLGSRQVESSAPVSDVLLPRWAHGSAREFVRLHRQALESEYVSAHLHEW